MFHKVLFIFGFFAGLELTLCRGSFAYIDPGAGSYILQVLAAVFFGSVFALKMYWKKLTGFLARKKPQDHDAER